MRYRPEGGSAGQTLVFDAVVKNERDRKRGGERKGLFCNRTLG